MLKKTLNGVVLAFFVAAGSSVYGQYYIQQGYGMDANTRLGSGGINPARPAYQPNVTNRIVTGNVTGGAAFRGFSPIRDPSSFFLGATPGTVGTGSALLPGTGGRLGGLPSDRLTDFRRDSVGINELRRMPVSPLRMPMPYYSSSSTVMNTGQIRQGLNQPGTSQVRSSYEPIQRDTYAQPPSPLELARRPGVGSPLSVDDRLVRIATGQAVTGPTNPRLLRSPLFAGVRQVPLSTVSAEADRAAPAPMTGLADRTAAPIRPQRRGGLAGAEDRLDAREDRPRDARFGQPAPERPMGWPAENIQLPPDSSKGHGRLRRLIDEEATAEEAPSGSLARRVGGPIEDEAAAAPGQRRLAQPYFDPGEESMRTFVGTTDERLGEQLAEAESLLRDGRYYDAARRYEMAQAIDLRNPLPLFGKGMALLAAGDYVSSANDLFMAIQLAGRRGAIEIDLQQFVPDLKILDRRRAFLEQQLEAYDDFRLRFLLGWAEYMSDMPDRGLQNMRAAAQVAPQTMASLREFVDTLAARQSTRPNTATQPG